MAIMMDWFNAERGIRRGLPDKPGNETLRFAVCVSRYCDDYEHARDPYSGGASIPHMDVLNIGDEWEVEYQRTEGRA